MDVDAWVRGFMEGISTLTVDLSNDCIWTIITVFIADGCGDDTRCYRSSYQHDQQPQPNGCAPGILNDESGDHTF